MILETLGVVRGQPILAFNPHAAKARLERLPWIRGAAVERRLPDSDSCAPRSNANRSPGGKTKDGLR